MGLTLFISLRTPERNAQPYLYVALILEALAGLSAIPFFLVTQPSRSIARIALAAFAAAAAAFLLFTVRTMQERLRSIREQREQRRRRL